MIFFEISNLEDTSRFFRIRHQRYLELVFSRFIQRTKRIFSNFSLQLAPSFGAGQKLLSIRNRPMVLTQQD
jgi:hypothetical protein